MFIDNVKGRVQPPQPSAHCINNVGFAAYLPLVAKFITFWAADPGLECHVCQRHCETLPAPESNPWNPMLGFPSIRTSRFADKGWFFDLLRGQRFCWNETYMWPQNWQKGILLRNSNCRIVPETSISKHQGRWNSCVRDSGRSWKPQSLLLGGSVYSHLSQHHQV